MICGEGGKGSSCCRWLGGEDFLFFKGVVLVFMWSGVKGAFTWTRDKAIARNTGTRGPIIMRVHGYGSDREIQIN